MNNINAQLKVESSFSADRSDSDSDTIVNYEYDSDNDESMVFWTDPWIVDEWENQYIEKLKNDTCKCSKMYWGPCSLVVDFDDVLSHSESCKEKTTSELDLIIKAQLSAHRKSGGTTSLKKHKIKAITEGFF